MHYSETDIPRLTEAFPPAVTEYLEDFSVQEIRDIVETLLYVYIAQNSCYQQGRGQGVVEQSCFAYTAGPLFALREVGLIEERSWHGMTIIRITAAGERVALPLMDARHRDLEIDTLVRYIHPAVPILLAGTVKGSYVNKTFPASLPESERTFVGFLLNNNPMLFEECEQFASRLRQAGCAVLAYAYDLDSCRADGTAYAFPPEFTHILKDVLEAIDPAVRDHYDQRFGEFYARYTALRFLATGEDQDMIRSSAAGRRELVRTLDYLGDAVYILEHIPRNAEDTPARFMIRDRALCETRLEELGRVLMREVAMVLDGEAGCGEADSSARDLPKPSSTAVIPGEIPDMGGDIPSGAMSVPDIPTVKEDAAVEEDEPEREDAAADVVETAPVSTPTKNRKRNQQKAPLPEKKPPFMPAADLPVPAPGDDLDVFLGYTGEGEIVRWSPGKLNNGHMIILGGSGAGKTETIRCIAGELNARQMPVVLLDFHGDMAATSGALRSYKIKEGSAYYFNPLELDTDIDEITPLRATSDFVDAISINFPTLGIQQRRKIKNIIKDCYRMGGITADPETWSRRLDFDDIEREIMDCEDEAIPAYLEDIFDYKLFSGDEKISIPTILSGGVTHINLNALPESLRYLFADLFLRRIYYTLQATGEIPRGTKDEKEKFRLFVIVDEAKLLVSQKSGSKTTVKAVLNKYATEMRKFGVSLILASQLIAHFNEEILANIAVKFCMRAENKKQAQENAKFFEVGEADLMNFQPGEGILIIGSERLNVRIVPASERHL
ncbi:ATP-binding protein [Methanoculleus frigidifontis]|uniref:ATP-binding protein n=1 Tax=Methanoculleus frigidifontis TaxID=2584085 RepID=UPI00265B3C98|nr:ATP-binding protein [Methanoculleus sp. FWC-SCC1]